MQSALQKFSQTDRQAWPLASEWPCRSAGLEAFVYRALSGGEIESFGLNSKRIVWSCGSAVVSNTLTKYKCSRYGLMDECGGKKRSVLTKYK